MPEPVNTATIVAGAAAVPVLSAFGVPLGLRPDELLAGFGGALAAIAFLNSVPSTGDTWRELVRTSVRRVFVAMASALTAAYLVPMTKTISPVPVPLEFELGLCFVCGAGAQRMLRVAIDKTAQKVETV